MNRTILSALLASLILSATAMAQLAGTYTIDSSTPTGGGNYTSFIDAANALMAQGVSTTAPGDVTFVVIAGRSNAIVANNSISMPAASNWPCIFLMGNSAAVPNLPSECSNNILQHTGTGACFQTEFAGGFGTVHDHNLFDPIGGGVVGAIGTSLTAPTSTYASLPLWQMATGVDSDSIQAPAGFVSSTDLHIVAGVAAWNAGSLVSAVQDDIDQEPRCTSIPEIGADEIPAPGLCARFGSSVQVGPPPLKVTFLDQSYASPGPITSWAWDFDNNGTIDSTVQNPTYVYTCPGSYTVSLTVTDGVNPPANWTLPNYITVAGFLFDIATTGGGVGDLLITPIPTSCGQAMGATSGWTLVSLATSLPVGAGPAFGLVPDVSFWTFLFEPQIPGYLPHFTVTTGLYPDAGPVFLPPGSVSGLAGQTLDGVMVFLGPANNIVHISNIARATF